MKLSKPAIKPLVVLLFLLLSLLSDIYGQQTDQEPELPTLSGKHPKPLKIGLYRSAPFVIYENDSIRGMAIDLWENIAVKDGIGYSYIKYDSPGELLKAVQNSEVDLALSNLTITQERAKYVNFTQPWYQGGLRLMVSSVPRGGLKGVIKGLYQSGYVHAYLWIGFAILLGTLLITLFDRKFNPDYPKRWREGLAEGFYNVMSVATSGKFPARKNYFGWLGRIWQGLWLACGIALLAFITSSVTSVMTKMELQHQIRSVADLGQDPVGVRKETEAEDYARGTGLNYRSYQNLDDAVNALQKGEVTAIIGDDPLLRYYVYKNPDQKVKVIGRNINHDKYGFAYPLDSELGRALNLYILGEVDAGFVDELKRKYFGNEIKE